MAWKYRYLELPVLMLGAVAVAQCSSGAKTGDECASYEPGPNGTLVCVTDPSTAGSPVTSGTNTNGTTGIPNLDMTASTNAGTTGIPNLDSTTGNVTSAGPVTGTSAGTTSTTGTGGTGQGPSTASEASVTTDAGSPSTTGGGGTRLGTLRVSAGTIARDHSIVNFPYPEAAGKALSLTDSQGVEIPLQYSSATGNASFIVTALGAGETADYTINELAAAMPAGITATVGPDTTGDQLFLKIGETKVFRWTLVEDNFRGAQSRDVRAGYIYPVYTPSGLNVADDYQVDHPHMHGIWSAWTLTTFRGHKVDFWNGYDNSGRVDLKDVAGIWSGPVTAGLVANLVHSDITTTPSVAALNETWIVTVYKTHDGAVPYFVYDIDSTQTTASEEPLILETYTYGGFGFRGSEEWQTPGNVSFLTSEGHDRASGDGQSANWVAQYGTVAGQVAGYAAFDHPTNFRHKQGLRIHPSNPYWAFSACTQGSGGRFTIEPGAPYHSLYRVVAFDGAADATLLNRLYSDFGEPPTVEILP